MKHSFLAPMPPIISRIAHDEAEREHDRANKLAYVCGCLNLRTDEVTRLLVERKVDIGIVYERLQLTQYYGRCDLSIDFLFGSQEPHP